MKQTFNSFSRLEEIRIEKENIRLSIENEYNTAVNNLRNEQNAAYANLRLHAVECDALLKTLIPHKSKIRVIIYRSQSPDVVYEGIFTKHITSSKGLFNMIVDGQETETTISVMTCVKEFEII